MAYQLDHVVLWVEDPVRSAEFYRDVLGLEPLRLAEYRRGAAPFVSVRITPATIVDLTPRRSAPGLDEALGAPGSAGHPVNHLCLAMSAQEYDALRGRLAAAGHPVGPDQADLYGARGLAPRSCYFGDPDGNVIEARHYGG